MLLPETVSPVVWQVIFTSWDFLYDLTTAWFVPGPERQLTVVPVMG